MANDKLFQIVGAALLKLRAAAAVLLRGSCRSIASEDLG